MTLSRKLLLGVSLTSAYLIKASPLQRRATQPSQVDASALGGFKIVGDSVVAAQQLFLGTDHQVCFFSYFLFHLFVFLGFDPPSRTLFLFLFLFLFLLPIPIPNFFVLFLRERKRERVPLKAKVWFRCGGVPPFTAPTHGTRHTAPIPTPTHGDTPNISRRNRKPQEKRVSRTLQ